MTGGVRYAKPNAQIRAMLSRLLTAEQKRRLLNATDVADVAHQLAGTDYAKPLAPVLSGAISLPAIEKALTSILVDSYARVIATLSGSSQDLVVEMLRRLELNNVKTIIRAIVKATAAEEVESMLIPLGRFSQLPLADLLQVDNLADALDTLASTPYAQVIGNALDRFAQEHSLFPIEIALDLDYYRRLWRKVEALGGQDKKIACRLMGIRYDVLNIEWLVRYRLLYNLSPEEIFNYTLPFGYHINDELVRRAALVPDFLTLVSSLPEPYRSLLSTITPANEVAEHAESVLSGYLVTVAERSLVGYPFQIGVVIAYLWLREAELRDLRAIFEGKASGLSAEEIRELMISRG